MLVLPENPRYLVKRDREDAAIRSLSRLRSLPVDDPDLLRELEEIKGNYRYELSLGKSTYWDTVADRNIRYRLFTGIGLHAWQQLSGVNFIFYYGTQFLQRSGISNPFIIQLITNIVNIVMTLPGLYLFEKWGRRRLLLFGAAGMLICQFIVAITGTVTSSDVANKVLIAFVCIYIAHFACSWGPVAWVWCSEAFPLKVRAKCLSMTTASNWVLNFPIAFATPYLVDSGPGNADLGAKVFFIWGACCVGCLVFTYFFIYETKGLSLEQIDELFAKCKSARKSGKFVPATSFSHVGHMVGGTGARKDSTLADIEKSAVEKA